MGLLKRRIIESEEPKEEPPMVNTVDTDIVESLRYVAQSAKPVDAGQMREAANEIERLRAERRWIPVEERLPDELKSVLILVPDLPEAEHVVDIGWYATSSWGVDWIGREGLSVSPTHWMPLPEPPTE